MLIAMREQTSFIGYGRAAASGHTFDVKSRLTGENLSSSFRSATNDDVDRAVHLASAAFRTYRNLGGVRHGELLRAIADALESRREEIVQVGMHETALPEARLNGELGRTTGQLRMFAGIAEEGSWQDVKIDKAQPDRQPAPAPDVRSMLRPLGPVAVFGASNFPLAFSVAGGDTASAFAAGCPVVVKAHPAHPGTSALAAEAVIEAAQKTGMPEGVFSLLFDHGISVGEHLVRHAGIKAVGFTGSRKAGLALWRLANERENPIPVYAEMGSINPVVVFPNKLNEEFARGLQASATMGGGQFCTNPGLVITIGEAEAFTASYKSLMAGASECTMLTDTISRNYVEGVRSIAAAAGLLEVAVDGATPAVAEVSSADFLRERALHEEVFGPFTLLVTCRDKQEAIVVIRSLEGQLTGSIHGSPEELGDSADLVEELEDRVGRLIVNQFPTGVEVNSSMVHGGPFPATTDARTTSVGGRAILRWARPVCYQNFPPPLLPPSLR
jgi:alpha-ketoglutaric semialdehyde dehydrogenase